MKRYLLFLLIFLQISAFGQSFSKGNIVVPLIASTYPNDANFVNPAELTLNDQIFSAELDFSAINNQAGLQLFAHAIDVWGLGDFAIGSDFYGSDLPNNLVVIERAVDCDDNPFEKCIESSLALIESGTKFHFTWAKETRFLSLGVQYRYYQFRNIKNFSKSRYTHSFDAGFFITPFTETYFGLVARNIGDSTIRDHDGNPVREDGAQLQFMETLILTFGLTSTSRDLALSAALPLQLLRDIDKGSNDVLKKASFQLTKFFGNQFELTGGYSSRDIYARFGYQVNPYLKFSVTGAKQAIEGVESYVSFAINLGLPSTLFDTPGARGQVRNEKDKMEDDILDDMESEVDEDLDELKRKKKKIQKYRKKKEIERDIENI